MVHGATAGAASEYLEKSQAEGGDGGIGTGPVIAASRDQRMEGSLSIENVFIDDC